MKKGGLGKGLEEIFDDVELAYAKDLQSGRAADLVKEIDVDLIVPNPHQPRKIFDDEALKELSQSIEKHGLIQPIIVIENMAGGYMIIAGERRFRATKLLGKKSIKAIIAKFQDKNFRELALIENIQRENLTPIELANSYKELIDEYKITQEELSNIIKKSRTQITNTIRLLNLTQKTKELIDSGKLSQGHAKIIVGLSPKDEEVVVNSIIGQGLNVRQTEDLVKRVKGGFSQTKPTQIPSEYSDGLNLLSDKFANLQIKSKIKGKNLLITFDKVDEIYNLLEKISKI